MKLKISNENLILLEAIKKGYKFNIDNNIVGPRGIPLKLILSTTGYPKFSIGICSITKNIMVHKFKAYFLYGEAMFEPGIQVRHKNGNKNDWGNSNILLGTQSQNKMDIPEKERIRIAKNAASYLRKFTDNEVDLLRKMNKCGISYTRLAKAYKTCRATLSYIMNNKTYRCNTISSL